MFGIFGSLMDQLTHPGKATKGTVEPEEPWKLRGHVEQLKKSWLFRG